jgi:hypothetical protein
VDQKYHEIFFAVGRSGVYGDVVGHAFACKGFDGHRRFSTD